jgi:hypothetical protein
MDWKHVTTLARISSLQCMQLQEPPPAGPGAVVSLYLCCTALGRWLMGW